MSHFLFDNVLPRGTQLLGRYVIEAQVARGGSSTIYRALDERLDRVVCVKVYRGPLGQGLEGAAAGVDRTVFSLFRREAFALSRLQHPNTLRIYDMGVLESEARPFQVTEYLDGGNLEQHVRSRGPLSPPEALEILGPIASAVVEAHGFGLVHRDIKPSNILFARAGSTLVPKLADFGIAASSRALGPPEGSDAITLSGMVYSPHWAAPEQLVSKPVGPSTDVYALALLTLFMLTGSTPFYVENVLSTFLERVRGTGAVEDYFEHWSFNPALRAVLLEALGPDPALRLASATELSQRVGRALGAPAPFTAPGPLAFGPPGAAPAGEPGAPAAVLTGAAASAAALAGAGALAGD
ncbi:MAG TPA: serine/threonine-protein kinase, partial [Polyangiaceae bacterium]|nr:serine/threonine-protein kinase [Polyangiaceae bacterium]